MNIRAGISLAVLLGLGLSSPVRVGTQRRGEANASARFAALGEITPANISRLTVAWTAHVGEFPGGRGPEPGRQVEGFQTRPVLAGELLIVTTTTSKIIALDAESGAERWRFDPFAARPRRCEAPHRGVTLWPSGDGLRSLTRQLVFSGTCDGRLVALEASTGRLHTPFGDDGVLNLRPGVDARDDEAYGVTSPPVIYRDLVITGALAPEGTSTGPAGDVRAFDVHTGREVWRFHTVPRDGAAAATWPPAARVRRTGVNVWSQMSVDEERGLVFLPLGSASYDFYGGDRAGQNLYGNTLVALEAATGARRWHFQIVHHDVWDYDLPAQPILAEIRRDGRTVPVVVQLTKMGLVYVFDRTDGTPVFGIEERPVPQSDVPGERTWPTQPFPLKPAPLSRVTALTRAELTDVTPESQRECETMFDQSRSGGLFTPVGLDLTLSFPGTMGGATWSGGAIDETRGLLFVNTNEIGAIARMAPEPAGSPIAYRRASPWGAYARFWDSNQLPCQRPPWGLLHAVDLRTGDIAWQVPLGDAPQLAARGVTGTGTPSIGGAIATSSGLVFIAGTNDARFRAFSAETGALLWQATLPASGHATPLTYTAPRSGRQVVVIAAGGGGRFSKTVADAIVAFALPAETAGQ